MSDNSIAASVAISTKNLGMAFPIQKPSLRLSLETLGKRLLGQRVTSPEYQVFSDLSFDIRRGEVMGIIGRNGCGKTTLLKILSRVLVPKQGSAEIYGSVASLLSVGTGFHPGYTGRENIFFNGMLLGLDRSFIERRLESIIEFAEIGDFIDQPVKTYSSGMQARLAFSVAAQLDADVVILDEILSVGDAGFREKCMNHMRKMKFSGKTILLVSHNMGVIENFCDRAMLIQAGALAAIGDPADVVKQYLAGIDSSVEKFEDLPVGERIDREGTGALRVIDFRVLSGGNVVIQTPTAGDDITLEFEVTVIDDIGIAPIDFGIGVFSENGAKLVRFGTEITASSFHNMPKNAVIRLHIGRFPLASGTYIIGFRANQGKTVLDYLPNAFRLKVGVGDFFGTGVILDHSPIFYPHEWSVETSKRDLAYFQTIDRTESDL